MDRLRFNDLARWWDLKNKPGGSEVHRTKLRYVLVVWRIMGNTLVRKYSSDVLDFALGSAGPASGHFWQIRIWWICSAHVKNEMVKVGYLQ